VTIPTSSKWVRLDGLHPKFIARLEALFTDSRIAGNLTVCSGVRSYADQQRLYKKYRAGRGNLAANPDRRFGEKALDGQGIWRGSWHMEQFDGWGYAVDFRLIGKALTTADVNRIATEYGIRPTVPSEWWHHQPRKSTDWFPAPALSGGTASRPEKAPAERHDAPKHKMDWKAIVAAIHAQRETVRKVPLKRGTRNPAVKTAQLRLGANGCDPGIPDGIFGRRTMAATKRFQKKRVLNVTGTIDTVTWDALFT
jgi:hypothetical protein